jgi:hypothetical protein
LSFALRLLTFTFSSVFGISTVEVQGPNLKSALDSDCGPAASLLAAGVSAGGGEATAVFVAAKTSTFRIAIKAAMKKTMALVDSKPLVDAAKLLNQGKFSTSRLINNVLASISDLNLEFYHNSGKMYKNCPDDFASRFPAQCKDANNCKIHSFIRDCTKLTVSRISISASLPEGVLVGSLKTEDDNILKDILTGKARLPLDNPKALAFLQGRDRDLVRVRELLMAGQRPSDKRDHKPVKLFFRNDIKTTIDKHGCLVVVKRNRNTLVTRELVIIPNKMSVGLLYSLHINLKHPPQDQLHKAVETRFYISNIANKCQEVSDACTLCVSSKPIPMEVYD